MGIEGVSAVFGIAFQLFIPGAELSETFQKWSCEALSWSSPLKFTEKKLSGTVLSKCQFAAQYGGDSVRLEDHLLKRVQLEAVKTYSGPNPDQIGEYVGTRIEVDVRISGANEPPTLAQEDIFVGHTPKNRVIYQSKSKSIRSESSTNTLTQLNIEARIGALPTPTETATHTLEIESTLTLQRPFYIPESIFKSMAEKEITQKVTTTQEQVVKEAAENY